MVRLNHTQEKVHKYIRQIYLDCTVNESGLLRKNLAPTLLTMQLRHDYMQLPLGHT